MRAAMDTENTSKTIGQIIQGLPTGALAGIVIALVAFLIIVAVSVILCCWRCRRSPNRRRDRERAGNVQIQGDNDGFVNSGTIVMGNQINETEGSKRNSHGGAAAAGIAGAIGGTTVAGPVGGVVGGAAGLAGGYVVDKFLK